MLVKQLNSSYFWSPVEKTDFSIGVVIPVTHVNEVLNTLQIPKGKDGFSLTSLTHHRPAILFLSPKESPSLKARYQLIVSCDGGGGGRRVAKPGAKGFIIINVCLPPLI